MTWRRIWKLVIFIIIIDLKFGMMKETVITLSRAAYLQRKINVTFMDLGL